MKTTRVSTYALSLARIISCMVFVWMLIYPGMHPFIMGVVILFMASAAVLSIAWVVSWFVLGRKLKMMGVVTISVMLLVFLWIALTWRSYNRRYTEWEQRVVGRYYHPDGRGYIAIEGDHSWNTDYTAWKCQRGTWKFTITEDGMDYLELSCPGDGFEFQQTEVPRRDSLLLMLPVDTVKFMRVDSRDKSIR